MKQVTSAINQLDKALTEDDSCVCIVDRESNLNGAVVLCKGNSEELANLVGATILAGLQSDSEEQNETGNLLFEAIENALIGLMAYNDEIYDRITRHIMAIPGKPCIITPLK